MSESSKTVEVDPLVLQQIEFYLDKLKPLAEYYNKLEGLSKEAKISAQDKITEFALSLKMGKLDKESLEAFFRRPYPKLEEARDVKGRLVPNSWRLTVPRFIPLSVGWLETQDEAWNYFRVNRYMDWFGEIPDFIKKQIGWKEAPDLKLEGEELVGSSEALEMVKKKYGPLVEKDKEGKVLVNPNRYYDLIVALLREGVKPFSDRPIDPEDLIERKCDYELRPYQREVWNIFCRKSNIGVFIPPGTGKTVIGVWALTHLPPPHLVVVPTVTLVEQWEERIQSHTDLKLNEEVFVVTYVTAIKRFADRRFTLKIYDEVHHIPAKYYIKLTGMKSKYGMGLSATPYREDEGGEELIFALTGEPTGLSWQYFKELRLIKSPICHVWVEKNMDAKLKRLASLLQVQKKTVIFSDSIELGKSVAARYNIPFVYGASEERLKTLAESQTTVISRVGDEGVSLPDIERVIEISWLFGSRRQELQRFTRLLHGQTQVEGEAHVIMTLEEYVRDRKRLFSVMDRAFKVEVHHEGVTEKVIQREEAQPVRTRPTAAPPEREPLLPTPSLPTGITQRFPGISKRLASMPEIQRQVVSTVCGNPGHGYSAQELSLVTGFAVATIRHRARLGDLQKQGFIKFQGGKWWSAL